jgi:hypothetical protein
MAEPMPRSLARPLIYTTLLIGLGLVLGAASISAPAAGARQDMRTWVAGYVYGDHAFGQIVQPAHRDLVGVRLWLPRPVAPGTGTLILTVHPISGGEALAMARIAVADLPSRGPATFRFDPVPLDRAEGGLPAPLMLTLKGEGIDRSSAVSVMAGPNRYSNGALVRDGLLIPRADLAFELLYRASWFDRILPITQIARSRPGIFAWPPLYALLAYGLLVTLGRFLSRLAYTLLFEDPPAVGGDLNG